MIYLTGDTHGERDRMTFYRNCYHWGPEDILIVCGDFGYIWEGDREERDYLDRLEQLPFTLCFIDGNHENFTLLDAFPVEMWKGGKVHHIRRNIYHLMRGQVFTIEGRRFFTFGGAHSIDWEQRKIYRDWWPQELPSPEDYQEGKKNLTACGYRVDYVLTHTAPASIIWKLSRQLGFPLDDTDGELTCYLDILRRELQFEHWYFGHFHEDMEAADRFTLLYTEVVTPQGLPRQWRH